MSSDRLRRWLFCALFAALTAICSQIQIPLPMVPINLALFAVHLCGALLGPRDGALSLTIYICLGAIGAPVFVGFMGGFGVLLGKTGGYAVGYILCAAIVGLLCQRWSSFPLQCAGMALGVGACYTFGTIWFMVVTHLDLWTSLVYCVWPFLPGDAVKILLAAWVTRRLKPIFLQNGWCAPSPKAN